MKGRNDDAAVVERGGEREGGTERIEKARAAADSIMYTTVPL